MNRFKKLIDRPKKYAHKFFSYIYDNCLQSSEVLKIQLQNAHTVMTIARLKLIQYLAVFRKHIPGDSTHELHQSMDGIEEVSIITATEQFNKSCGKIN